MWGANTYGQLGDGTNKDRNAPVQVKGLTNIKTIYAGDLQVLALKENGTVWTWGRNVFGKLGDGTNKDRNVPVQVKGLTDIIAVSAGKYINVALKEDGTVWVWGVASEESNHAIKLENYYCINMPVQAEGLTDVKEIFADVGDRVIALKKDGTVWAFENNEKPAKAVRKESIIYFIWEKLFE
jgi:alpha-tubulin suppressor-like RCC1 family protein